MSQTIFHIYDKVFKKVLTLSSKAVINLINGLFGTDYPEDSTIRYNWTEFVDGELKKTLADTIITINEKSSYHLEAQMTTDETIVLRVFKYGFSHANRNLVSNETCSELCFPEPKIIYFAPEKSIPEEYTLRLNFGSQGYFDYKVSAFLFNQISAQELNQKKMIILIPFMLLKLRDAMSKSRSKDNLEALKNLIQHDILESIEENLRLNNITQMDAQKLRRYTHKLYEHIYSHYEELEELNEMTDESLMLDIDIIEKEHEQRLEEMERAIEEKRNVIKEQEDTIKKKDTVIKNQDNAIKERDDALKEKDDALREKDDALKEKNDALKEKNDALKEKNDALREKDDALREKDDALREKNDALREKDDEISALKEHIRQLEKQAAGLN